MEEGYVQRDGSPSLHGVSLDVLNLSYSVVIDKIVCPLLRNINLSIRAGSMVALMGPSGAGKSTLLDLLADRKRDGLWSGEIFINNNPRSRFFTRDSAYVLQDDIHIPTLTVAETIYYSAWTRMPGGTSKDDINNRVELLLGMMGLLPIRDSFIGDSMTKGISGGQLKRVSIAVELVAMPELIFLDEPTSGLDSSIALEVMTVAHKLCLEKRTVISTIHQPSPQVFSLFDTVVLLSGGRLIYCGDAARVVEYFMSPKLGYFGAASKNKPAEFICEVAAGSKKIQCSHANGMRTPAQLEILFKKSEFCTQVRRPVSYGTITTDKHRDYDPSVLQNKETADASDHAHLHATSSYIQFQMLMTRSWVNHVRDVREHQGLLAKNVVVGLLIGIVFWNQGETSEPLFENSVPTSQCISVSSLLFFGQMYVLMGNIQSIPYLCGLNTLYRREISSFTYSCAPFWLSQCIINIPALVFYHMVFSLVVFWMVKFKDTFEYFLYFYSVLLLGNLCSYFFAMFLAAATGSQVLAFAIFPLVFIFLTTFAGYSIAIGDLPPMWKWAADISFARWGFEGLMVNQWDDFETDDSPYTVTGQGNILATYDFTGFNKNNTIWIMLLYIIAIVVAVYFAMKPKANSLKAVPDATDINISSSGRAERTASTGLIMHAMGDGTKNTSTIVTSNPVLQQSLLGPDSDTMVDSFISGDIENSNNEEDWVESDTFDASVVDDAADSSDDWYTEKGGKSSEGVERSRGCRLTFRHLEYTVLVKDPNATMFSRSPSTEKTLLRGVMGRAQPGEMVALMGSSGAGKSTLLDILAGRKNTGNISGQIYINGHNIKKDSSPVNFSSAYVTQDNIHVAVLTVRESLDYAAELRLPETMSSVEKSLRVDKIVHMLGLHKVENSVIGDADTRGISGGQLKRLSIGVEIIALPDLIFCDEPTTGLDAAVSETVMSAVRLLADQNRTVICTIHQPSVDVFKMFDKLILLAEGRLIYFGPLKEAKNYFLHSVYSFPYANFDNPADYVVAVAGGFVLGTRQDGSDESKICAEALEKLYLQSDFHSAFKKNIDGLLELDKAALVTSSTSAQSVTARAIEEYHPGKQNAYGTSTTHQLKTLCSRVLLQTSRRRIEMFVGWMRYALTALFYGSIYWKLATGTDSTVYTNRISLIFFSLIFMIVSHQLQMPLILDSRLVFYRERGSNLYDALPYWISLWFLEIPLQFINVLTYSVIMYFMAELSSRPGCFEYFLIVTYLTSMCGLFVNQLVAALAPTAAAAFSLFPVALFLIVAFAGYIVYLPQFPAWLGAWGPNITFLRFSQQGLVMNEFRDNNDLPYSDEYLHMMGYNDDVSKGECVAILIAFLFLLAAILLFTLKFLNHEKR